MNLIEKTKNILLNSNNSLSENEIKKIKAFQSKIRNNEDIEDEDTIRKIILHYKYPKVLKKSALKLYEHTDIKNLVFCAYNLTDVEVLKKALYGKDSEGHTIRISAAYFPSKNILVYQNKKDIYHEFIHMSSRNPLSENNGFQNYDNPSIHTTGINEGYTELLSRRIFYNGNYNTESYKLYVYVMLIFECLYDDKKDMERDYFSANFNALKNTFLKYGSEEEFHKLINLLNREIWLLKTEDKIEIIKFIKDIVQRTYDKTKINQANQMEDEYLSKEHINIKRYI